MNRLLRISEVMAIVGKGRSSIYKGVSDGTFPKPVKVTPRTSAWVESEVQEWIDNRIAERDAALCGEQPDADEAAAEREDVGTESRSVRGQGRVQRAHGG